MYKIAINGNTVQESSFASVKRFLDGMVQRRIASLRTPIRQGVYRSPKVTSRLNAERLSMADRLADGIKYPKTAQAFAGSIGGISFAVSKD